MRKILITSIIVLLLCSTLAVIVQASAPITSIAGVNIISSTKINNSTFDNLTVNESMAVAQTAINNYLSGKTKTLSFQAVQSLDYQDPTCESYTNYVACC